VGLAAIWFLLCMFSTTGGYHRLFAHRTYHGSAPLRLFYLLFGAASGQASAATWSADHRTHHANTDEDLDPYNIKKGFWWAHVGWLFWRTPAPDRTNVADLLKDPLVRFQDRHYLSLLLAVGFLLPTLIASAWGDAAGGLLLAGFLRLLVQYHSTFAINSVAHTIGRRPYSTAVSARDSFITAILTLGEGYHNYHHRFPGDYRNGIRFFHFDPTKWWIWLLSKAGFASGLKRVPRDLIERARIAVVGKYFSQSTG
jgi:stearoyl-CoA desaturase (delta-9 desaturase)